MMANPPSPYQRVAYLESSGSGQYIIMLPNQASRPVTSFDFTLRLRFTQVPVSAYKGCGITTNTKQFFVGFNANANTAIYMGFADSATNTLAKQLVGNDQTGWHTYRVVCDGTTTIYTVDGIEVLRHTTPLTNLQALLLFGMAQANGNLIAYSAGTQQISEARLVLNGSPVFDLMAVRDGQAGYMYDQVTNQLFGSDGGTAMTAGPDL